MQRPAYQRQFKLWTHNREIWWGLIWLFLGVLVYVIVRQPGVSFLPNNWNLYGFVSPDYTWFFGSFPTLAHVVAFSLFSIAILNLHNIGKILVCGFWALINILFELGQSSDVSFWLNQWIAQWTDLGLGLNGVTNYFLLGTFDIIDVLAALFGALTAGIISIHQLDIREDKTDEH